MNTSRSRNCMVEFWMFASRTESMPRSCLLMTAQPTARGKSCSIWSEVMKALRPFDSVEILGKLRHLRLVLKLAEVRSLSPWMRICRMIHRKYHGSSKNWMTDLMLSVVGNRCDTSLHKVLPSRVFNWLVSRLTGVKLHDHNCGFKAYRREIFDEVELYGERHRFIPVLAAARGWKPSEIVVEHHARRFGHSKYGFSG